MSQTLTPQEKALADTHHLARGAVVNALVLVAANFRGVFTFLIARLLGEAGLGRFTLVYATIDIVSKVAMMGLDAAVVPLMAKEEAAGHREGSRRLFIRAVVTGLVISAVMTIAGLPLVAWLADREHLEEFSSGGIVMLLALPGLAVARIATGASRAALSMHDEFYSRGLVETWTTTGVFLIAMALGLRDTAPSLAVVAGSTGSAIVAVVLAKRALGRPRPGLVSISDRPLPGTLDMVRFSMPTAWSSLLNSLAMRVDVLLLGAFVGHAPGVTLESFGVFCAAAEAAGSLRKVRQVFDPIFVPVAATRHASGARDDVRQTVAGPGRWVLAGQLPVVGVMILAGGTVLSIFGPGFKSGGTWLAILAVSHAANSFAGFVDALLIIERPWLNVVNAVVTVAVQAIVGLLLIPFFGVTGAAIGMAAGFTLQGVLRFVELRHVYGWTWPWASLTRPVVVFTVSFMPAVVLRIAGGPRLEILSAVVFVLLYAAAWFRVGPDAEDREVWKRLTKRA